MWNVVSRWLFDPEGLTPHGFCLLWEPGLIWTYAVSDIGIGIAYFTIPMALAIFVRRRTDLVFRPVFGLFAAFILLCGATHWLDVLTLWVPAYGVQVVVKAATAVVSLVTAVTLWRMLPQALVIPSAAQLREAHAALQASEERLHQSQKMEIVGQLTGGIAHDFNNMLQAIAGGLTLLERRIAQGRIAEVVELVAAIRKSLNRAAGLTHRLLAFSRRQTLQPSAVEPDRLVRGMDELIRRTIGPGVTLELRLNDGVWNARSDPNQLESALLNLAINARDAMPEGGTLTIASADRHMTAEILTPQDEAEPGNYVEIRVIDTGVGMSADVLARAFEPFFTTKPIGTGTGLGLSQLYGFVRQSGGFVRLESAPAKGTTVRIFLPRDDSAALAPSRASPAAAGDATVSVRGRTVLVVEDEEDVRLQIAESLREAGCNVLQATDGPSGLRVVQSDVRFDLLVTDVGLPGLNGRQLAEAARAGRPNLPVLMITGYAGAMPIDLALPDGVQVLGKPFTLAALSERVSAMLAPDPA